MFALIPSPLSDINGSSHLQDLVHEENCKSGFFEAAHCEFAATISLATECARGDSG
jgi:hypothetical protein